MKHPKLNFKRINPYYLIIVILAIVCYVFFQNYYSYLFFYKEQNQIFLMSWNYVASYFSKPAWAACLIGDFVTQFYYYLYAGAIIITLALLTMGDILRRSLQKAGLNNNISFIIAIIAMTLEAVCHFNSEFHMSSTVAIIGGAAIFYIVSLITKINKGKLINEIIIILSAAISYWMFGYGWFIFVILAIISGLKRSSIKIAVLRLSYIPIFMLCIHFTQKIYLLNDKENYTYPGLGELKRPEMNLERYLMIDNEYYFGHYNKVLILCSKMDSMPEHISFFYNLALAHQGLLANSLDIVHPTNLGTFYHIGPSTPLIIIKMMNELYYSLGDMTLTERAAMMANVFSPNNRNVRMIKRLAEANLVNNDIPAAEKYLRILENTIVYNKWAKDHMPGHQTYSVKAEIAEKRKYVNKTDTLRLNDNCRDVLIELLNSNPKNKIALDYLLCSDLIARQIGLFKLDYDKYYALQKRKNTELVYSEALEFYNKNNPNK